MDTYVEMEYEADEPHSNAQIECPSCSFQDAKPMSKMDPYPKFHRHLRNIMSLVTRGE